MKQILDDTVSNLNKITADKRKTDGMHILTTFCDNLGSVTASRLFDNIILRNHPIFDYIGRTFEMLLTKSNCSQTITMTKQEEECLSATSYLIVQLCLYQNEPVELFYGKVPTEVYPVTEKPNRRAENIIKTNKKSDELMEKPNLKTARLAPSAPMARPIEKRQPDINKVQKLKKFPNQFISTSNHTQVDFPTHESNRIELPAKKFQDIFLTKLFFHQSIRAIEDLSRNEYSSYHIKYKVANRLVRLCSELNIVDQLLDPIIACLRSKYYCNIFQTIERNQIQLTPKQLLFIQQLPQFLIKNNFLHQEKVVDALCKKIIKSTKPIFDKHFLATDIEIDSNADGDRRIIMQALSCHIEFLFHLSLTSSGRQYFLRNSIIDQLLIILRQNTLISSACQDEYLFNANVSIVAYSLMLLYNLAYELQIFSILKQADLHDVCIQLESAKDNAIQFALLTLLTILKQETIDENNEPTKLKEAYMKFLENIIIESEQVTRTDVARSMRAKENKKFVFLRGSFLETLIRDITHLSKQGYQSNENRYKNVAQQIRVCTTEETNVVESLLDPIILCLSSKFYVDVYQKIDINRVKIAKSNLAPKHLFFMRECPEFLIRHDYKRQEEVANSLGLKMLSIAETIFEQHLPILTEDEDKEETKEMKNGHIEALLYHIKLLNHFALTPSTRRVFLTTTIIDEILKLLENKTLIHSTGQIINSKSMIIEQLVTLLYNLSSNKQIFTLMKEKNVFGICSKLRLIKDKIVQFTSQVLIIKFDERKIDDIIEPQILAKFCIEYMDQCVKEPRRSYQGIKLNGILKSLEILIENDSVQKTIIDEREGISSLIKCAFVTCSDNPTLIIIKKIRRLSLKIIWKLLSYEPALSKKLKSDDSFVERLLIFLSETSDKEKKMPNRIIWKLGSEETFRIEQAEKKKKLGYDHHTEQHTTTIDEQFIGNDPWDDSVPFDIMISYNNDSKDDERICRKICNRLKSKNFKVYFEQQGKHRLESMKKAILKQKIILFCLSSKYRTSKVCMAEIEYASKQQCPIIPIIYETNYKIKGWINHLIGKKTVIDFTQKNFNDAFLKLTLLVETLKPSD